MRSVGRARIAIWEGGGLWILEAGHDRVGVPPHAHHAVQVTFLLDGRMTLGTAEAEHDWPIIAVDADAEHHLNLDGSAALLFIDPESDVGRAQRRGLFSERQATSLGPDRFADELDELRAAWRDQRSAADLKLIGQRLTQRLSGGASTVTTDARVANLIDRMGGRLGGPLNLADAARSIHLSPSRLRHLFVEQTGLPFKSYVLWRRLMKAVEMVADGSTMTEAAHAAGFSDSAHFSRTCRRTFGLPASALEYV